MINIKIEDETVLIDVNENERNFQKITNLQNFREAIGIREFEYDSGFLPGQYGTKRIFEDKNTKKVLYIEPPKRRTVEYYGYDYEDGEFDIMVPSALLIAKKRPDETQGRVSVFTPGLRTFVNGTEPLYEFPAPNIFSGTGEVCWGDNRNVYTDMKNVQTLQGLIPKFLSTPFNDDLMSGRMRESVIRVWKRMTEAFEDNKTEEEVLEMYENLLVPANCTFNDIW